MKKRPVAVFDIDGTIFRSSMLRELLEELITFGIFPLRAQKRYVNAYGKWLDRRGSYHVYRKAVIKSFQHFIKGIDPDIVHRASDSVMTFHQYRIYHYTKKLIKDLKRKGYYLVAISGSPEETVASFAHTLGFDEIHGRVFALGKKGKYTGVISNEKDIENKDRILNRILEMNPTLTLKDSVGVGDTYADAAFLKMVERPIAFNPSELLFNHAKKQKWEIVIERKDKIIEL